MRVVTALAMATLLTVWATPWAMHRRLDTTRWHSFLSWEGAWYWWAWNSIASFSSVMIVGRAFGTPSAAACALLVAGGYAWMFHRRFANVRRLERLCAGLKGESAESALRALEAEITRWRNAQELSGSRYEDWARLALHAAAQASMAQQTAHALRWIHMIDSTRLRLGLRAVYAQHAAAFHITMGDRAGARAILVGAPRPAEPKSFEDALLALEGLLDALEGNAGAALERADQALAAPLHERVRLTWRAVRAHGLAASGAIQETDKVLAELHAELGDYVLQRIANHGGPASAAAAKLLASLLPRGVP